MPMSFRFKGNKEFIESVVFEFDENKKVKNLSFQLEQEAVSDIASQEQWNKSSKHVLVRFLENYKTAYALERLDYLTEIFSDDALIIVGLIARWRLKLNYYTLMGLLAGSTTDPPALGYANTAAGNDMPAVGYATVYPVVMFLRVLTAQLLILMAA
jgi:hypothetical protein